MPRTRRENVSAWKFELKVWRSVINWWRNPAPFYVQKMYAGDMPTRVARITLWKEWKKGNIEVCITWGVCLCVEWCVLCVVCCVFVLHVSLWMRI